MRAARAGWLLVLPALALLAALAVYPVAYGIWLSFFSKHSFFPEQHFIGLANYAAVLADEEFWRSLKLGLIYSLSTIVLQLVLGTAAALLLNESFPGRGLVRAVSIFPYVVPTVVAVIIWKWLLNSQFGL
ncbi:MAG TPA: sugar ABC transporter permease, partial [Burkholderiales bacterium]